MALPTTISNLAVDPAVLGPFKSSAGNFYVFGKDSANGTVLRAMKATDPTSSFSSIATKTGFSTAILTMRAVRVSDVIHIILMDGTATSTNLKYQTFNMANDQFVTAESVLTGFNTSSAYYGALYYANLAIRSNGDVVAFFNGVRLKSQGTYYGRAYYAIRTTSWGSAVEVDDAGSVDYIVAGEILGASDRVHFLYRINSHKSLDSGNNLSTANSGAGNISPLQIIRYDSSGVIKLITGYTAGGSLCDIYGESSASTSFSFNYFDVSAKWGHWVTGADNSHRAYYYDGVVYVIFALADVLDLYCARSNDNGASWTGYDSAIFDTITATAPMLSFDGELYQRTAGWAIGYVVNDNGTLKYNEYYVVGESQTLTPSLIASDDNIIATEIFNNTVLGPYVAKDDVFLPPAIDYIVPGVISGIALIPAVCGPFQYGDASQFADRYYFFGRDSTDASVLRVKKSSINDPTSLDNSFITVAGDDFGGDILDIAGDRVGSVVHLAIAAGTSTNLGIYYRKFDFSTDSFIISETVASGLDVRIYNTGIAWADGHDILDNCLVGIAVRPSGEVVIPFQGQRYAPVLNYFAAVYYSRRLGANNWSSPVMYSEGVDNTDYIKPHACITGVSNKVILFLCPGYYGYGRLLDDSNNLGTSTIVTSGLNGIHYKNHWSTIHYNVGSQNFYGDTWTDVVVIAQAYSSPDYFQSTGYEGYLEEGHSYLDGGNIGWPDIYMGGRFYIWHGVTLDTFYGPIRLYADGVQPWAIGRGYDSDGNSDPTGGIDYHLYATRSSAQGVGENNYINFNYSQYIVPTNTTWEDREVPIPSCDGVHEAHDMSVDMTAYIRADYFRLPAIVNDSGTLKYIEFPCRSLGQSLTATVCIASDDQFYQPRVDPINLIASIYAPGDNIYAPIVCPALIPSEKYVDNDIFLVPRLDLYLFASLHEDEDQIYWNPIGRAVIDLDYTGTMFEVETRAEVFSIALTETFGLVEGQLRPSSHLVDDQFYVPTIEKGPVNVTANLITADDAFLTPTIVLFVFSELYSDDDNIYAVIVAAVNPFGVGLVDDIDEFFVPNVQGPPQYLEFTLIDADDVFGSAVVSFPHLVNRTTRLGPEGYPIAYKAEPGQLEPWLVASDDTFFEPSLEFGSSYLTAALFDDVDEIYAASLGVRPPFHEDQDTVYDPSLYASNPLALDLYSDDEAYFNPSLACSNSVTADLYVDEDTIYDFTAEITYPLTADLIPDDDVITFYPLIDYVLLIDLYDDDDNIYELMAISSYELTSVIYQDDDAIELPTIDFVLPCDLYVDDDAFYAATIETYLAVVAGIVESDDEIYVAGIEMPGSLATPEFAADDEFLTPEVQAGAITLDAAFVEDEDAVHAAAVENELSPAIVAADDTLFAATVVAGEVSLSPNLFDVGDVVYASNIALVQFIEPQRLIADEVFYAPVFSGIRFITAPFFQAVGAIHVAHLARTLQPQALFVDNDITYSPLLPTVPPLVNSGLVIYSPTIEHADFDLVAPRHEDEDIFLGASIGGEYTVEPGTVVDTDQFRGGTMIPDATIISPAIILSDDVFISGRAWDEIIDERHHIDGDHVDRDITGDAVRLIEYPEGTSIEEDAPPMLRELTDDRPAREIEPGDPVRILKDQTVREVAYPEGELEDA